MRLYEYVRSKGKGEQRRLQLATGLSYTTIQALVYERQLGGYDTAKLIEDATGKRVTVAEICEPRKGKSKLQARKYARKSKAKRGKA